jgi:flagellar hook-basal body complex protein FliE
MDPLSIQGALRGISGAGQLGSPELRPAGAPQPASPSIPQVSSDFPGMGSASGPSFGDTLAQYLGEVNTQAIAADKGMEDLAAGRSQNVHNVLISMQKADLQLKLLVETRNKAISAYQEIMRMQA